MKNRIAWLALAPFTLAACATGHWMGAEAEKSYDKALDTSRATAVLNNDDYYEIHKDGKIVVIADATDLKLYMSNGELPLRVTRIGGGPKGETVVFDIAKPEAGKKTGFGSVEMYDGKRQGADKDFYGEVLNEDKYYVFGNWAGLDAFRKSGEATQLSAAGAIGPNGETVMVAQPSDALIARFKTLHAK